MDGGAPFSRVWAPIVLAMVQAKCSGQEWAVLVALLRYQNDTPYLSMGTSQIARLTGLTESRVRTALVGLTKKTFELANGERYPIIQRVSSARRSHCARYAIVVPRDTTALPEEMRILTLDEVNRRKRGGDGASGAMREDDSELDLYWNRASD